jgi:hypothetical protein
MRLWSGKPSFVSRWTERARAGGVRYDAARARHGHVESWVLKANDPKTRRALWLRWAIWAGERDPRRAIAEVWAVAFGTRRGHIATKTSVPFTSAAFRRGSIGVTVDGATLTSASARGRVESGGRAIAYDLEIRADGPATVVSPIPAATLRGVLQVEGETWSVEDWPGMVGHDWGRAHAADQASGHCNAWEDGSEVVLEGFTTRSRATILPLHAPTAITVRDGRAPLLSAGYTPLAVLATEGSITPRRWRFRARGPGADVQGEMWADTDDLVGLFYTNPDGTTLHSLNTKLAQAEVVLRVDGQPPRTLRSHRASLEIATVDPHHGVRMHV